MTVEQLIQELQQQDPNLQINFTYYDDNSAYGGDNGQVDIQQSEDDENVLDIILTYEFK